MICSTCAALSCPGRDVCPAYVSRRTKGAAWSEPQQRWEDTGRCRVTWYEDGTLIRVGASAAYDRQHPDAPLRGDVCYLSKASRRRMLQTFGKLRTEAIARALFVTLTYPEVWPDPSGARRDLFTWWKRLTYDYPFASAVWRMEPQSGHRKEQTDTGRGAPHFHLVIFGVAFIPKEWLSESWYSVVGSGLAGHLAAGTNVQRVRAGRGVVGYIAKEMTGEKEGVFRAARSGEPISHTGRCWGILGRGNLPWGAPRFVYVNGDAARRSALELMASALDVPDETRAKVEGWTVFQSIAGVTEAAGLAFQEICEEASDAEPVGFYTEAEMSRKRPEALTWGSSNERVSSDADLPRLTSSRVCNLAEASA